MKLQIVSDLHMEFREPPEIKNAGADALVLAGDICLAYHLHRHPISNLMRNNSENGEKAFRYRQFFDNISQEFDTVYYVMGNHEHYNGRWNDTADWLREALEPWNNIILMDNTWINVGDVRIIGTTLWTSLNNADPLTMMSIKDMMMDYRAITIENSGVYHKLRPLDTFKANHLAVEFIKEGVRGWDGKVVVLGHHAPSYSSVHPKYASHILMNHAFVNELDDYIIDHPQIALWVHGHVHDCWDYKIGDTRIICNPRGYPGEINGFNPNFIVEI